MEDSPNDIDSSDVVSQDQSEDSCRKNTNDIERNLPSVREHVSENQCLPSPTQPKVSGRYSNESPTPSFQAPRSAKVLCDLTNQFIAPSLQAPNIDQFDETFSSADVNPSQELQSHTNRSSNEDALISPQHLVVTCTSMLGNPDNSEAKANQKDLPPVAASHNVDFTSPPERGTFPRIKSLSSNRKDINTPSPEKRNAETGVELTPIKRLRKTPESESSKPGTEIESSRSKLSFSAVSKTFYKSPTNIQSEQIRPEIQKNEISESPNSLCTPSKRKITCRSSVESTVNYSSNLISPSSLAETVDKSPTYLQIHGSNTAVRNADASTGERKKFISCRDLVQISILPVFLKESKSPSSEYTDASLETTNLTTEKQKCTKSTSDISDKGAMPNFKSEKADTNTQPTTFNGNLFVRRNILQEEILSVSELSPAILQPDLPVKKTELAKHPSDETSNSNRELASESQNNKTEGFESCTEVKKIQVSATVSAEETQSASNVVDSTVDSQILKSSQSSPVILIPHLCHSLHLPRIHRRSSDEMLTTRNLTEVPAKQDISNSAMECQSTGSSRSLSEISNSDNHTFSVIQSLLQEMLARIPSNTASVTVSPQEFSHSGHSNQLAQSLPSREKSMSRNDTELQMQQNRNAPLLQSRHVQFLSDKTSTSSNQPEGVRDTNLPHIDVVEGQATSSSYQPIVTVESSFDQSSNNIKIESEMSSDINVTGIESISTDNFYYDQSFFPTSRNRYAMDELSTVRGNYIRPTTATSSSSNNSSDIQLERHPEYIVHARVLLLSVLKEIMLYDGEDCLWRLFEDAFRGISVSHSQLDSLNLIASLARYLTKKAYDWCNGSLFLPIDLIERQTQSIYWKLTLMVIKALISNLRAPSTREYLEIVLNYVFFTSEFASFSRVLNFSNIEHIQDEVSRNRLKTLKEMIQRHLLVVQMAFQLLLMYVGENISETVMAEYEGMLADADKVYLRRNPMHRS